MLNNNYCFKYNVLYINRINTFKNNDVTYTLRTVNYNN